MTKRSANIFIFISIFIVTGCHRANVDAIEQQLQACGVAPQGPVCDDDEEGAAAARRFNAERFAARSITTIEKERCFLAVDCSDERRADEHDAIVDELISCIVNDGVVEGTSEGDRSSDEPDTAPEDDSAPEHDELTDCFLTCNDDLAACGDGSSTCSEHASLEACFDVHDRCSDRCWTSDQ
jgi:hypothetical protein